MNPPYKNDPLEKMSWKNHKTIGIIEGGGTGLKVADIFKKTINSICAEETRFLSFKETFGYSPHSFMGLARGYSNKGYSRLRALIEREEKDLKRFYAESAKKTAGIFRTAINAETLYYFS